MSDFTTRPEISGTFGVVTSTHWIASSVGMSILERGGNAFDAAVAAGFALQIVEPHLNGPGGDVTILLDATADSGPRVLCGQGVAPQKAAIEHFKGLGLDLVPGTGSLAAVVPGSFGAWMTMLRDYGTISLEEALAPAIHYARNGYPLVPRIVQAIADVSELFENDWPTSAAIYLKGGRPPDLSELFRNPAIAETWDRIVEAAASESSREKQIDVALDQFYRGFVAEAISEFMKSPLRDSTGQHNAGLLSQDDMAAWTASYDDPVSLAYGDYEVFKAGAWSQGPVFLQQLSLLKGFDLAAMDPLGADFVHTIVEAAKLAFADREAYYGDSGTTDVPLDTLLSETYAEQRRKLIGREASLDLIPGRAGAHDPKILDVSKFAFDDGPGVIGGAGEPTMARYDDKVLNAATGDTCHVDVIDRWGNMVAATPSGGWLQSSAAIPELGFSLTTRGQMFWLEEGLPASLEPGKRPRTTLSPSLARRDGEPYMVWGTPGGDQQDQWTVTQFLRHVHHGMNLQEACDCPLFHSAHFPSSFYPRQAVPGRLLVEDRFSDNAVNNLKRRGHDVEVDGPWTIGRMTAASQSNGVMKAGASPRGMQGYAVGR